MTVRVQLPGASNGKGCYGLKMPDGTQYNDKPGGSVTVSDEHARQIRSSSNGQLGIVSGVQATQIGTRLGQRCLRCGFLAQGWATECPKCRGPVAPE